MRKYCSFLLLILVLPIKSNAEVLKVGVVRFDPPFVLQVGKKQFDGFDISMMRFVCSEMDVECEFIPLPRKQLLDAVGKGDIDVAVSAIAVRPQNKVHFSIPYLINTIHIVGFKTIGKDHFHIGLIDNKSVGVADSVYSDQMKFLGLKNPKVSIFDQDDDMIDALNKGNIEFALVDTYTATYWKIHSAKFNDLGEAITLESSVAIAVNPSETGLKTEINKALTKYRNSKQFLRDFYKYLFRI